MMLDVIKCKISDYSKLASGYLYSKIYVATQIGKCVMIFFFFNDTATTEIYTLSLHDALPTSWVAALPSRSPSRSRRSGPRASGARPKTPPRNEIRCGAVAHPVTEGAMTCRTPATR